MKKSLLQVGNISQKKFLWVFVVIIYVVFAYVSISNNYLLVDEKLHHLPTMQSVMENGFWQTVMDSNKYLVANTPLPYLLTLMFLKVLGLKLTIFHLRLFNIIIGISILFVLKIYLNEKKTNNTNFLIILFSFYPYFIKPTFSYYMANYGILFFLLFLLTWNEKNNKRVFLSGTFLSLAVLSQQFYLLVVFPVIFLLFKSNERNYKELLFKILLFFISFIPELILFLSWGGLTNERFQSLHKVFFDVSHLVSIIVIIGFTFAIYFVYKIKNVSAKKFLLFFIVSLIIVYIIPIHFWIKGGEGKITGLTFHLVNLTSGIGEVFPFLFKALLFSIGILILLEISNILTSKSNNVIELLIFIFVIGFSFNVVLSERHILPLILLLFIALIPKIKNKKILIIWSSFQILLGSIYFLHIFNIKIFVQ